MRSVERDPAARTALERVQVRMRAIAAAFQSPEFQKDLKHSERKREDALDRLSAEIRAALLAAGDEFAAWGITAPQTLEDWEHIARVVEMPFVTVRSGDYTLRDVYVMALAWLDRQALLRRSVQAEPKAETGRGKPPRTFTVAALRELTDLHNAALNKYAKLAGVETPRRGQRNFCYGVADVRAILNTILSNTSEQKLRSRCQAGLRSIQEIAE